MVWKRSVSVSNFIIFICEYKIHAKIIVEKVAYRAMSKTRSLGWYMTTSSICVERWFLFAVIIFYFLVALSSLSLALLVPLTHSASQSSSFSLATLIHGCTLFHWKNLKTLMKNAKFYGTQVWNTRNITCAPNNESYFHIK